MTHRWWPPAATRACVPAGNQVTYKRTAISPGGLQEARGAVERGPALADGAHAALPSQELHVHVQGNGKRGSVGGITEGRKDGRKLARWLVSSNCLIGVHAHDAPSANHIHARAQVTFRVSKTASSLLVFGAWVWRDGTKLYDAAPVTLSQRDGGGRGSVLYDMLDAYLPFCALHPLQVAVTSKK